MKQEKKIDRVRNRTICCDDETFIMLKSYASKKLLPIGKALKNLLKDDLYRDDYKE